MVLLVDLVVGLGLFLVTWALINYLKVDFGLGIGLFDDLRLGLLFVGWFDVGVCFSF